MKIGGRTFLAILLAVQATRAQEPQRPIFRAGVDVVQIEISVLDGDRRPVHGLTKKDFQVFEDGKAQDIVDAQEILLDDGPPPPVWARAVPIDTSTNDLEDRRLLAIVMDDLHCCFSAMPTPSSTGRPHRSSDRWAIGNAISAAQALVKGLGPRDLATVALTHDAVPAIRFTNDQDELLSAIARFRPISEEGCMPQPPLPTPLRDLVELLAMSPQPLKAAVFLTSPVPLDFSNIMPCPNPSYRMPDTGQIVQGRAQRDPGPAPDRLGLANVPVYTLHVSGLIVDTNFGVGGFGSGLKLMSGQNPTGGYDYKNTNDLGPAVGAILDENGSYYLLGFHTSRPTTDGKYRRLDIKVPGHGEYTIRTRDGYLRPKPPPAPGSRADRNPEIARPVATVAGLLPVSDITLTTSAAAFPLPGGKAALITTIEVTHAIAESPASGSEELDMRTVAYVSGAVKHDVHAKTTIAVPAGVGRVSTSFPSRLDVTPDRYELWLTAHDARTNRVGGVIYNLEIPDFAARSITISGVVLGREPVAGAALAPTIAGIVPIVPTAARLFTQGDAITAYFQLYQGRETPLEAVSLKVRVLDDQGAAKLIKEELLGADRFAPKRSADYRLALPLSELTHGQYLLTIEARLGDRISPKRDVPFSVR